MILYQIKLNNKNPIEIQISKVLKESLFLQAIGRVKKEDDIIELDITQEMFFQVNEFLLKIDDHSAQLGFEISNNIEKYMTTEQFKELYKDFDIKKTKELLEVSEILDIPKLLNITAAYFSTLIKDQQPQYITKQLEGSK